MAQETPNLTVISLLNEEDKGNDKIVEYEKPRRNPILRYDQMYVTQTMYIKAQPLISIEDTICKYPNNRLGLGNNLNQRVGRRARLGL